ncbi:hypothetical protein CALVIDRAFT_356605 [Calocera viscosa TUFC12733]|uniref:Uncharacterized protein n=1 Tax=Calocera viscosa (strain TUFC12733) TaxID=1330018 RepID=A0A167QE70_CALVF|nr:hypothetical protein CALVIDRAFT_356605 [Calocera viscosa TUFC12733]
MYDTSVSQNRATTEARRLLVSIALSIIILRSGPALKSANKSYLHCSYKQNIALRCRWIGHVSTTTTRLANRRHGTPVQSEDERNKTEMNQMQATISIEGQTRKEETPTQGMPPSSTTIGFYEQWKALRQRGQSSSHRHHRSSVVTLLRDSVVTRGYGAVERRKERRMQELGNG